MDLRLKTSLAIDGKEDISLGSRAETSEVAQ